MQTTNFHILAKPTGAKCNLDCKYCFFLSKDKLYPKSNFRMSDEVLEAYIKQTIQTQNSPEVIFSWQGGEPTLMGLDFFKRAMDLERKHQRSETVILNTLQTNGILINDDWCKFFKQNNFLIGISLDGTKELHNYYRVDKRGHGTFDKVMNAIHLLKKHAVDFNLMTTVNSKNANHPLELYKFFRDELQAEFIQFIPVVEKLNNDVSEESVTARQWGDFLNTVFDEWVKKDVGKIFVQMFDAALASWYGLPSSMCIFSEKCGASLALEHNGDLYSCDHYVEPTFLIGNILEHPTNHLVASEKQIKFGNAKLDTLPSDCLNCSVRFACHGECPKNRFIKTTNGESGLNYLCEGYKAFFKHIDEPMKYMAQKLRANQAPSDIMLTVQN